MYIPSKNQFPFVGTALRSYFSFFSIFSLNIQCKRSHTGSEGDLEPMFSGLEDEFRTLLTKFIFSLCCVYLLISCSFLSWDLFSESLRFCLSFLLFRLEYDLVWPRLFGWHRLSNFKSFWSRIPNLSILNFEFLSLFGLFENLFKISSGKSSPIDLLLCSLLNSCSV